MFSKIKLQTSFTLVFSVIMLIMIMAIYWFIDYFVLDAYEQVMIGNSRQLNVELSEQIDLYLSDLNQLSKNSVSNQNLMADMRQLDKLTHELTQYENLFFDRNFESYSSYLLNYSEMSPSNVYIYGRQNRFKFAYGTLPLTSNFESVYERVADGDRLLGRVVFYYHNANTADNVTQPSISVIRAFTEINGYGLGFIEIQQDYTMLDKIADLGESGKVFVLDEAGRIIYPAEKLEDDQIRLLHAVIHQENEGMRVEPHFYTYVTSDTSGLTTVIRHENEQVFKPFYRLRNTTLIAVTLMSLYSVLSVYFVTRQLTKPIRMLRNRVLKLDFDNISLFTNRTSPNNEINLLNDAFQQMIDRLRHSMEKEMAATMEEMRARFSALQAQIAPHFIHNTLYLISILAEEGRREDVINMCKRLSNMLRYMAESPNRSVMLEDEMAYTHDYLTLIQYKYEDFIELDIDVQEDAAAVLLPRLTIQPIVENAIKHAFNDSDPPWKIAISCTRDAKEWKIVISDNGSGIPETELASLQKQIADLLAAESFSLDQSDGIGGLGIINTVMRLKMLYPDSLRFELASFPGSGTRITIRASLQPKSFATRRSGHVSGHDRRRQHPDRP